MAKPHIAAIETRYAGCLFRSRLEARDGLTDDNTQWFRSAWLEPTCEPRLTVDRLVDAAYGAARSARFEFGQSPTPTGEF